MSDNSWGVTKEQLEDIQKNYGGRIVFASRRNGGAPKFGKLISFNKKHAVIQFGSFAERVMLSELRPPSEYRYVLEPTPMPPESAPRPVTFTPGATTGMGRVGTNIVVVAAQLEQRASIVQAKREEFVKIEADYIAAKEIRDSYKADIEKMEKEYREIEAMLRTATAALLTGGMDELKGRGGVYNNPAAVPVQSHK